MRRPAYRIFREGVPHHVFVRSIGGSMMFYSTEDCIFYVTLYACLARKYHASVLGFSLMPNHAHSCESALDRQAFRSFHDELNSKFTIGYNELHDRKGPLLESPFGFAAKTVGKKIRDNLCYIANNAIVGKLSPDILSYRWNLLSYYLSDHPFSEKLVLRDASAPMRRAVTHVNYFRKHGIPLNGARQSLIYRGLDKEERRQILDYIISRYNCLDYPSMIAYYNGSFEQACISFRANSGSEHDIAEDYENYGIYVRMLQLAEKNGIDLKHCNFTRMNPETIGRLEFVFQHEGFPQRQIDRFLCKGGGG